MSPFSGPVVLGTLVVGSPAMYAAYTGMLSTNVALVRVLICLVAVWAACSLVASIAQSTVASNNAANNAADATRVDLEAIPVPIEESDAA
ncbi:hypothetical protein [Nocardioides mangrovi]|uniref:YihY/virulence factor BrkB family protein n=1 Tax=Nocardioides mangrovi TaxID=2874580 RepID=A0ABS7UA19_9ACTN|nr:hypothetical protein [Nocardioides mangrovi]MBZ5737831.1 hypothetical protein [Nocardioides mangrovi]